MYRCPSCLGKQSEPFYARLQQSVGQRDTFAKGISRLQISLTCDLETKQLLPKVDCSCKSGRMNVICGEQVHQRVQKQMGAMCSMRRAGM